MLVGCFRSWLLKKTNKRKNSFSAVSILNLLQKINKKLALIIISVIFLKAVSYSFIY